MHGTYAQHIRDTRAMWAKMPKTSPLSETLTMDEALAITPDCDRGDLADGHIVYLADSTNLRKNADGTVRHWR